jgi:DNA-binding cell septation regulator SpoVG
MSNIKTIDPIIDINLEHKTAILEAGASVQTRPYPATNYTASGGVTQWNIAVPSKNCFTDRCFYLDCEILVTYTGTTTAQFNAGYDSLRAYPLANCMINPTINFQNAGITQRVQEFINALLWYHNHKKYSACPTYLDRYQLYSDGLGTNRNSMGIYENTVAEHQRGAFPLETLTITSTTGASFTARIAEPIFMAPLNDEQDEGLGFTNLSQLAIEIPWSDLTRMVSHSAYPSQVLSSISVVFTRAPILWLRHVIPRVPLMRAVSYPHQQIISYPTSAGSIAPNASATVQCNNIQLDRVPKKIYVFACPSVGSKTYNSTDTFCAITNLSVQYDNIPNQLSTASPQMLYEISRENGCQMTYPEFSGLTLNHEGTGFIGTVGSVFCGRFGTNIICNGTPGDVYPTNLQVQVTVKNVNQSDTLSVNAYVVVVFDSKMVIDVDGLVRIENGIDHSMPSEYAPFSAIRKYEGAGFKDFIKKLWGFFKNEVVPVVKDLAPIVLPIMKPLMGMGQVAGGNVGGKHITERQLLKALRN